MKQHRLGRPKETRRTLLFEGRVFQVARCELLYQNGRKSNNDLVLHHGAAVFAPLPDKKSILLVRQYRHAAGGYLWEIPAGRLEPGERPLAAAKRELAEECRLRAARWRRVASFLPAPGYTTEWMHLFFASGLRPDDSGAQPDADEELDVKAFTLRELHAMVRGGKITDGKTIVASAYLHAI